MTIQPALHTVLNPATGWGAALYGVAFATVTIVVARLFRVGAERVLERGAWHPLERTTAGFLIQTGQIAIYVIAAVLYCHLIPALRAMGTALLTGASVLSVVFGLAAQATLGNVIAGAAIVLYRPFRVGDRVQLALSSGTIVGIVRSLNLGYTVLTTDDETRVVVPNNVMASQAFVSFTATDRRTLASVSVQVPADVDPANLRDRLLAFARHYKLVHEAAATVRPSTANDGSVILRIRAWCSNADAARQVETELFDRARAALDSLTKAPARADAGVPAGARS